MHNPTSVNSTWKQPYFNPLKVRSEALSCKMYLGCIHHLSIWICLCKHLHSPHIKENANFKYSALYDNKLRWCFVQKCDQKSGSNGCCVLCFTYNDMSLRSKNVWHWLPLCHGLDIPTFAFFRHISMWQTLSD